MKKVIAAIKWIVEKLKNTQKGASLLWFRDFDLNEYE